MNYIIDIIIVLIILLGIIMGSRKGLVFMVVSFAGLLAAFFAASFVSSVGSEYIYENVVRSHIIKIIDSKTDEVIADYNPVDILTESCKEYYPDLSSEQINAIIRKNSDYLSENAEIKKSLLTDERFSDTLNGVYKNFGVKITEKMDDVFPDEIVLKARDYFDDNDISVNEQLSMLSNQKKSMGNMIEGIIIRPFAVKIIGYIVFAVTFSLVTLIFKIVSSALRIFERLPGVKNLNSFFGGLLGLFKSLIFVFIIVLLCNVFINITSNDNTVINTNVISETHFFKWVYYGSFSLLTKLQEAFVNKNV